jgi:hypothetical protein
VAGVGVRAVLVRDHVGDAALAGAAKTRPVIVPANGVFLGTSLSQARAYRRWFAGAGVGSVTGAGRVDLVVDFSTRQTWAQIADPHDMLEEWRGSGFRPVYSIALLPAEDLSATIRSGAAGRYDRYFRELATNLVEADQPTAILRLGWEFNLESSRWASDDPEAFIAYWRRIVAAMRAVPGSEFEFDWNPNNGKNKYDAVAYYPGDDVVDYIGVDAYDISWAWRTYPYPQACDPDCRLARQKAAWQKAIHGGKRGLEFWSAFARRRGKPMSLPEWGLWSRLDGHGGGDDSYYLREMHGFIADPDNGVAYQAYFEFDGSDGPHRLMTTFPAAGDTFRTLFARPSSE